MSKFKTATTEINGKKYTAQFNGLSEKNKAEDRAYLANSPALSLEKLGKYCLENVIVKPKLRFEDFGKDKIGQEKTTTINGVEYTARFNGILEGLRMVDNCYIDNTAKTSSVKTYEYLFKHVIVSPKNLTEDDFECQEDLDELVAFASEVMQGDGVMEEYNKVFAFAREVMDGSYFRKNPVEEETGKGSAE